jgi:hypothetical protein
VGADDVVAEALTQLVGQALGQAPGVHEDQGGVVLSDEGGDPVEHVSHLLAGGDRLQLPLGQLEGQVEVAAVAGVDDRTGLGGGLPAEHPGQQLDRPLRGRQPDALGPGVGGPLEPLEGQRQVRAALVARRGVDLVDDHRLDRAQHLAAAGGGDHEVQRLGGGDEEVGRAADHVGPLAGRGIARADAHRQVRRREAQFGGDLGDLPQGPLQVFGDVDRQSPQR